MSCLICVLLILSLLVVHGNDGFFNPFRGAFHTQHSQEDNEYYDIMGLDRSANIDEVKRMYRSRAMQLHPDKGGDPEQFKKLSEAYEVLSNPEQRANYDRFGKEGMSGNSGVGGGSREFQTAQDLARELFRGFGGGAFSSGGPFAMPVVFQLDLSLEDFYKGRELVVPISNLRINVSIRPGMMNGQELLLKGQIQDNGINRDLIFRLREVRHHFFRRKNNDLLIELSITLREALCGFTKTLKHLDGSSFTLKSRRGEVVQHQQCFVVEGKGMPIYNGQSNRPNSKSKILTGKLFVLCKVEMPKRFNIKKSGDIEEFDRLLSVLEGSSSSNTNAAGHSNHEGGGKRRSKRQNVEEEAVDDKQKKEKPLMLEPADLSGFGRSAFSMFDDDDDEQSSPFTQYFFR